jgi:hypothetical protein
VHSESVVVIIQVGQVQKRVNKFAKEQPTGSQRGPPTVVLTGPDDV